MMVNVLPKFAQDHRELWHGHLVEVGYTTATTQWWKCQPTVVPSRSWMLLFSQIHMTADYSQLHLQLHLLKGRRQSGFFLTNGTCENTSGNALRMKKWTSPPKVESKKSLLSRLPKKSHSIVSIEYAWTTWRNANWMHWVLVHKSCPEMKFERHQWQ